MLAFIVFYDLASFASHFSWSSLSLLLISLMFSTTCWVSISSHNSAPDAGAKPYQVTENMQCLYPTPTSISVLVSRMAQDISHCLVFLSETLKTFLCATVFLRCFIFSFFSMSKLQGWRGTWSRSRRTRLQLNGLSMRFKLKGTSGNRKSTNNFGDFSNLSRRASFQDFGSGACAETLDGRISNASKCG